MERIKLKDGELSQKSTRIRGACIGCENLKRRPAKRAHKWQYYCGYYGLLLTWSGYSNYNQYFLHTKGCPVKEITI
ncbi:MAG: hypothetical protein WC455_31065 [Dehalococcoidia bacterium]